MNKIKDGQRGCRQRRDGSLHNKGTGTEKEQCPFGDQ